MVNKDEKQPKHWLAYVRWDVRDAWYGIKRAKNGSTKSRSADADEEPDFPYAYGSDDCRFYEKVRQGDTLWLMTLPKYAGYHLPPCLLARLDVKDCIDRTRPPGEDEEVHPAVANYNYVAKAFEQEHSYLQLNNMFLCLKKRIRFCGKNEDLRKYDERTPLEEHRLGPYYVLGNFFRRFRQIRPDAIQHIESFHQAITEGHTVFLSYKLDRKEGVEELAEQIDARGISCWWNKWMLEDWDSKAPGQPDEGNLLEPMLQDGIRQSAWFVALVTRNYFSGLAVEELNYVREQMNSRTGTHKRKLIAVFFDDIPSEYANHGRELRNVACQCIEVRTDSERRELGNKLVEIITGS